MTAKKRVPWRGVALASLFGLFVLAAAFLFVSRPATLRVEPLAVITADGQQHKFTVEIADTPASQQRGLMFRKHMDDDRGMLFEFREVGPVSFWMKNTYIPLDMLFIAENGRVTAIHENAVPQSLEPLPSGGPVSAVLEINGGLARRLGIGIGSTVSHPFFGE